MSLKLQMPQSPGSTLHPLAKFLIQLVHSGVWDVVLKKIFCGDTSDNIGNIDGVSENRLFELMPEIKEHNIKQSCFIIS